MWERAAQKGRCEPTVDKGAKDKGAKQWKHDSRSRGQSDLAIDGFAIQHSRGCPRTGLGQASCQIGQTVLFASFRVSQVNGSGLGLLTKRAGGDKFGGLKTNANLTPRIRVPFHRGLKMNRDGGLWQRAPAELSLVCIDRIHLMNKIYLFEVCHVVN